MKSDVRQILFKDELLLHMQSIGYLLIYITYELELKEVMQGH